MSPLPNARVVPTGWSRHHAAAAAGGMNGRCRIYDPATETRGEDPVTESVTVDRGVPVYADACRVQALLEANTDVAGDEQQRSRRYLVQLLFDAPHVEAGWVLVPHGCINDPELDDRVLYVHDVQSGTERFTRDLVCSTTLP